MPRNRRGPTVREVRERLIAALKRRPLFRNVSVRLIADLVDRYGITRVPAEGLAVVDPAILAVFEGEVELRREPGEMPSPASSSTDAMGLPDASLTPLTIPTGVHLRNRGLQSDLDWSVLRLRPKDPDRPVHVFSLPVSEFRTNLPRALVNALDQDEAGDVARFAAPQVSQPSPLLVWMAHDRAEATPLEALTHLLAGAVATDLPFPVVIVTLGRAGGLCIQEWDGTDFGPPTAPSPQLPLDADALRSLITRSRHRAAASQGGWVFVVHLDDPLHLPPPDHPLYAFEPDTKFDRAVLLTDEVPKSIRDELVNLLDPTLFMNPKSSARCGLGFCAVTPTVLAGTMPGVGSGRRRDLDGSGFETNDELRDDRLGMCGPEGDRARLFRDACCLALDLPALQTAWARRNDARALLGRVDAGMRERIRRWGRAVTNRQVGVAVSGGGAAAFRLAGLMKRLDEAGVPVDVVAGLSGGALIGAYYCTLGGKGLTQVIERGRLFGALLPLAVVSSWFIEKAIDLDLEGTRIGETDVRFVPVTARLAPRVAPCACVVTKGTIGEAVRVSGTLPPLFGATTKNEARYTDGGAATLVPAEIVRCSGADLTVSYNVIGEPADGDPLQGLPWGLGKVLDALPLVGRLVDMWVWTTFLWARASRQFGECADVPIRFYADDFEMFEPMAWGSAADIARKGYEDEEVITQVGEVLKLWRQLQVRWP